MLINYVKAVKTLSRAAHGSARSWRFVKLATAGPVVFPSRHRAKSRSQAAGINNVRELRADDGSARASRCMRLICRSECGDGFMPSPLFLFVVTLRLPLRSERCASPHSPFVVTLDSAQGVNAALTTLFRSW